jgi:hypothetical protein
LDWALGSMDSSKGKKKSGPDNEIAAKFDSLAVGKDFVSFFPARVLPTFRR